VALRGAARSRRSRRSIPDADGAHGSRDGEMHKKGMGAAARSHARPGRAVAGRAIHRVRAKSRHFQQGTAGARQHTGTCGLGAIILPAWRVAHPGRPRILGRLSKDRHIIAGGRANLRPVTRLLRCAVRIAPRRQRHGNGNDRSSGRSRHRRASSLITAGKSRRSPRGCAGSQGALRPMSSRGVVWREWQEFCSNRAYL